MPLVFREEDHSYWMDGVWIPSVTTILSKGAPFYAKGSARRGSDVHALSVLLDMGEITVDQAPEAYRGYLKAWEDFKQEGRFTPELIEVQGYCGALAEPFAGTIDRIGQVRDARVLLDIKTGNREAWHDLQVAAYSYLSGVDEVETANGIDAVRWSATDCELWLVYLSKEGHYKVKALDAADMMNAKVGFSSKLTEYYLKERKVRQ